MKLLRTSQRTAGKKGDVVTAGWNINLRGGLYGFHWELNIISYGTQSCGSAVDASPLLASLPETESSRGLIALGRCLKSKGINLLIQTHLSNCGTDLYLRLYQQRVAGPRNQLC